MTFLEYINSEDRKFYLPDIGLNGLKLFDYNVLDVYLDSDKQLQIMKRLYKDLKTDFVYSVSDGNVLYDALGLSIHYKKNEYPELLNTYDIEDYKVLAHIDIKKSQRVIENGLTVKKISNHFTIPYFTSIRGPFTLMNQIFGFENIQKLMKENKFLAEEILKMLSDIIIEYASLLIENGAKMISIAEPFSSLYSADDFKVVKRHLNYIYQNLNAWTSLHICGDTEHIIDDIMNINVDSISLDQCMDYIEIKKILPKDKILIGNIDNKLLAYASLEEIRQETERLSDLFSDSDYFIHGFGCTCLNTTPIEHLKETFDIGRKPPYR